MRRPAFLAAALAVVGGTAFLVFDRPPSGPFPSAGDLRARGFAAWPVDTVQEAEEECADPEEWRLDARATAEQFAQQIMRYPDPAAGESFGEAEHHVRLLINTRGVRGVFLGSALDLARYGRCWYVVEGQPREGDLDATLGFVYRDGRAQLLIGHPSDVPAGFVGYGDWETEIGPELRGGALWMPALDPDATGHVIYTRPDEQGVSEMVGARALPPIPPPPAAPSAEALGPGDVRDDRAVCRVESARPGSPERVIRNLYQGPFFDVDGRARESFRRLGRDRWRIVVDDAVLIATITEIAGRCYKLVSLVPADGDPPLRRLRIDEETVTFEIDWRRGDDASVAFGTGFEALRTALAQIDEPVTFERPTESQLVGVPAFVRVILYEKGRIASAYYGLFETP